MAEELKRYIVVTDFYIYAETDDQALRKAKHHAAIQSGKLDDRCSVDKLYEMPEGTIKKREIKIS